MESNFKSVNKSIFANFVENLLNFLSPKTERRNNNNIFKNP